MKKIYIPLLILGLVAFSVGWSVLDPVLAESTSAVILGWCFLITVPLLILIIYNTFSFSGEVQDAAVEFNSEDTAVKDTFIKSSKRPIRINRISIVLCVLVGLILVIAILCLMFRPDNMNPKRASVCLLAVEMILLIVFFLFWWADVLLARVFGNALRATINSTEMSKLKDLGKKEGIRGLALKHELLLYSIKLVDIPGIFASAFAIGVGFAMKSLLVGGATEADAATTLMPLYVSGFITGTLALHLGLTQTTFFMLNRMRKTGGYRIEITTGRELEVHRTILTASTDV